MKIFVDTANLDEIRRAISQGFIRGITTNPSLLAKEPKGVFENHIKRIIELIRQGEEDGDLVKNQTHLSVEVFSDDPKTILDQALRFREVFDYESLSIKVPVGETKLSVISKLNREGISVNCTCCMSTNQALMAAGSGARYVSFFWGRIRDILQSGKPADTEGFTWASGEDALFQLDELDTDPSFVVGSTRALLEKEFPAVEIIAGSIRRATDVRDAALAGAHIVTVPPKFFKPMVGHFKTDEVEKEFLTNFKDWMK